MYRPCATGSVALDLARIEAFDGLAGLAVAFARTLVVEIVAEVGTDDDQCFRPAPKRLQELGNRVRRRLDTKFFNSQSIFPRELKLTHFKGNGGVIVGADKPAFMTAMGRKPPDRVSAALFQITSAICSRAVV